VGRRDTEPVAGALNEPLFELVGEVLGSLTLPTTASSANQPPLVLHDVAFGA
jgi:hypothetical protein